MDKYVSLIQMLSIAISKKDMEIREVANLLAFRRNDYNAHVRLKRETDKSLKVREEQKDILDNYDQIISGEKKKCAKKVIIKTLGLLISTMIGISFSASVPGLNAFIYVVSVLIEAAIVSSEISYYQIKVEPYRELHEETTIDVLEQEIGALKEARRGLEKQIEGLDQLMTSINQQLTSLKNERAHLIGQYNGVITKRSRLLANNSHWTENDLNVQYTQDEEILKLERKLNNGENI